MEVDSPPETVSISPEERIVQRLLHCGVPKEQLSQLQPGLMAFLKENKLHLLDLVSAILPAEEDVSAILQKDTMEESSGDLKDFFRASITWVLWVMFGDEPSAVLKNLAKSSSGQQGVCGAVWGHNDIAYRCRTCEHDPTCAICVSCFQNGDHKNHDYSMIYTGGGCCDCGDVTAWKRQGFCSKHKGPEQIQPLPEEIANSAGPVLDALLLCWRDKLLAVENGGNGDHNVVQRRVANELSSAVVRMLLDFCNCSESLLSFIAKRMFPVSLDLLGVLVRAESFLNKEVLRDLHELLLKLLGEPIFKYEFAKVFVKNYPNIVKEAIRENSDARTEKNPVLSTFAVQIFTVPTLTPQLVREVNLLGVLLGSLADLFLNSTGEDGCLQFNGWTSAFDACLRLVDDIRFVMSHVEVSKYVAEERPDISKTWIKLLALVQGMDPQKRVMGLHVEEENENLHLSGILELSISKVHPLFVAGAFSSEDTEGMKDRTLSDITTQDLDDSDRLRHAKVGRLSEGSSVCSMMGRGCELTYNPRYTRSFPFSVTWLMFECLKAIDNWLEHNGTSRRFLNSISPDTSVNTVSKRRAKVKIRHGRSILRVFQFEAGTENDRNPGWTDTNYAVDVDDMDLDHACLTRLLDDGNAGADSAVELEALGTLSSIDWPEIVYDGSSQDISFHIPLHRLFTSLLHKSMEKYCRESGMLDTEKMFSGGSHDFFKQVLGRFHPNGFSAFMMEHPLRLRVFCAEVRAGMWRKNGDAAIANCEWYHSVRWCEQSLEPDLFLLQCCAALAPPDAFVKRIQERFALSNYFSLDFTRLNEYEPVLVQEMLTLIIQIVKERRFCGLSVTESLRRELVYRLAIGDATHSQLVKALPQSLSSCDQFQHIVDTIAAYSNPSGVKQGKYSLQKAYWKELDLYHPRWNSRDLQMAEERYSRFCKASALTLQLPRWTHVFHPLNRISLIATCKAVLQIVRTVFIYAVFTEKSSISRAPDGVLLTALHLLSLGLDICCIRKQAVVDKYGDNIVLPFIVDGEDSFPILAYACEEIFVGAVYGPEVSNHQSMLSLLVLLLKKFKKENEHTTESSNFNISFLIETLLKKLAELDNACMFKLQILAPQVVSHLLEHSQDGGAQVSVPASDAEERKAKAREHQAAIMRKMRAAQSKFIESLNESAKEELDFSESEQEVSSSTAKHTLEGSAPVVCSLCRDPDSKNPLSFLILLQKSRLISLVERGPSSWDEDHQGDQEGISVSTNDADFSGSQVLSRNSEVISPRHLAQLIQTAANEFAGVGRPAEVDAFLDFIRMHLPAIRNTEVPNSSSDASGDMVSTFDMAEENINQSIYSDIHEILFHLNVLEEDQMSPRSREAEGETSRSTESTVLGEYVASLPRMAPDQPASENGLQSSRNALSKSYYQTAPFDGFGPADCDGIHVSSCGHAMHQECRDRYLQSLRQRYIRRIGFEGVHIVDPDQGEFLCPVCRRLANSVLPASCGGSNKIGKQNLLSNLSSLSFAGSSSSSVSDASNLHLAHALSLLRSAGNLVEKKEFRKAVSDRLDESMGPDLESVFRVLCRMYFPDKYDSLSRSGRVNHSLLLWDALRYSLISTEITARAGKSKMYSGGYISTIEALYKEVNSPTGFILSLLLQVAQASQSQNHLQVLLRFRGIQLFSRSICSGLSFDESSRGSRNSKVLPLLKNVDMGEDFPDVQFWKRAADPVLVHDPFSSLMWVLFCLPLPFPSSTESFISLVQLFYVVCVIQAIITCRGKHNFDITGLRCGEHLIKDIYKIMGESEVGQQYFVSNYFDFSCSPEDMIRRFTHPYLRRCALLWNLLKSSASAPFCDRSNGWESSLRVKNDTIESTSNISIELKEVQELEQVFKISSLEVVLEDDMVCILALEWCKHFCNKLGVRNFGRNIHSTPAVPFRLMHLPHVYQDLVQRYIKLQCPECKSIPELPALCLLCGRICSPPWKQCCRESCVQNHALTCGAGIGVFMLIRKTTILLLRSARQAPWPSPYLDAFGEEDIDLQRGKPLYLNEERYAALTHMVVSHGLDRSSEVLRQTTLDTLFIT